MVGLAVHPATPSSLQSWRALGYPDGESNGRTTKSNPLLRKTTIWLPYFLARMGFFFDFCHFLPKNNQFTPNGRKRLKTRFPTHGKRKEKAGNRKSMWCH